MVLLMKNIELLLEIYYENGEVTSSYDIEAGADYNSDCVMMIILMTMK